MNTISCRIDHNGAGSIDKISRRYLLDSLGCAFGGYQQEDVRIAMEVLEEIAGNGPSTLIGSGRRVDPVSAALANALMVRVMDYNDIYWQQDPSHPSDIIPAALAAAERAELDCRDLLVGIVLGHEFEMRLCEAAFPGIRERGWHHPCQKRRPPSSTRT